MPRRPRKQPGLSKRTDFKKAPKSFNKNDGKMNKWDKFEDIELDEEDQFHQSRDRILLEGEIHENDEDWEGGEEEVFGLGLATDSESASDEELSGDNEESPQKKATPTSKAKKGKVDKHAPSTSSSESESEEETWGRGKSAYYASNSEFLSQTQGDENEDELNDMEEQEARKIQTRMKNLLLEEDYGLDDVQDSLPDLSEDGNISSALPISAPAEPMDKTAAWRYLERNSPEALALSREWCDLLEDLQQAENRLQNGVTLNSDDDMISSGFKHLYHHTLLSYMTILAFYMHLRASEVNVLVPSNFPSARSKAVLGRLLTLKQALSVMEDLDFDASDDESSDILGHSTSGSEEEPVLNTKDKRKTAVSMEELHALLEEADEIVESRPNGVRKSTSRGSGKDKALGKPQKKTNATQKDVTFDLVEPSFKPSRPSKRPIRNDNTSDIHGEMIELLAADSMDKKARRHTLRFHTHKIESSVKKREQHRERLGGDDDLPYSERKKEKELRVQKEVLKTRGMGGDDLDAGGDDDSVLHSNAAKRKRGGSSDSESEDGYYELVKRAKQEHKEVKKQVYEQSRLAERLPDEDGTEGPRSLTRAILKNRGLTPRRSKSVRNPRVKKRERYEKAQKKVKSQKAVYKKEMVGRPYSGEQSGISKVVKSVKLG